MTLAKRQRVEGEKVRDGKSSGEAETLGTWSRSYTIPDIKMGRDLHCRGHLSCPLSWGESQELRKSLVVEPKERKNNKGSLVLLVESRTHD